MAYAFVQAKGNSAGSGTTVVVTFDGEVAVGGVIVAQIYVNANRTFTVSENGTGTALVWSSVRRNQIGATAEPYHQVFKAKNVDKTGLTAITITLNSTTAETKYATAAEYSGLTGDLAGVSAGANPGFFQAASASGIASATTSDMTPDPMPVALISCAIGDLAIGSRPLDTSNPTDYLTNNRVSEMTNQMRLGDLRETVQANETVTWSWSGGNQRMGLVLAAFVEEATGPTATSLDVTTGTYLGGTEVTLTGTALDTVTGATLQGDAITDFVDTNPTTATFTTPGGDPGYGDLVVTDGSNPDTLTDAFFYEGVVSVGNPNGTDASGDATGTLTSTLWAPTGLAKRVKLTPTIGGVVCDPRCVKLLEP